MFGLRKNDFPFDSFSLSDDKKKLRDLYKKRVNQLTLSEKLQKQQRIVTLLSKLPFWKEAHYIAFYYALKDEPCLSSFYKLWPDKACFPVINRSALDFYINQGPWQNNKFSFKEPLREPENKVPLSEISVFLIPGRAFDRKGGRLGRGYGYYDKTLALLREKHPLFYKKQKESEGIAVPYFRKGPLFIGVGFTEQIHKEPLPTLEHDIFMDVLVTDLFVLTPVPAFQKVSEDLNES